MPNWQKKTGKDSWKIFENLKITTNVVINLPRPPPLPKYYPKRTMKNYYKYKKRGL